MTTATVSFESINGTMSIQLDRATFEQVLQVRDLCNELLAAFELEAVSVA
ncbi:hypothetical protein J5O04_02850 [Corynebacterium hindlerae]|nr:hypothetical protein [Corynebacterium hindlerae]QTH60089.1 hypothetical protein J5O04_02850 [Corynebacterium hindlerae]